MIDGMLRKRRAGQFRKWYDTLPSAALKSSWKRRIIDGMLIGIQSFYDLLNGRVFINDERRYALRQIIGKDIFA